MTHFPERFLTQKPVAPGTACGAPEELKGQGFPRKSLPFQNLVPNIHRNSTHGKCVIFRRDFCARNRPRLAQRRTKQTAPFRITRAP
jgi:hypothetical protein